MLTEKYFEDLICKYPELIEEGLILRSRQLTLYGRRMDILFEDRFKRKLIIELKIGPIKDEHIGQILSYEGIILSSEDPTIRVMLVGNRVPPNIQRTLDHHGIAWKEIPISQLSQFVKDKKDENFLDLFRDETLSDIKIGIVKEKAKEANGMNYWIFTHINENAESNFERLIKIRNWQISGSQWTHLIKKDDSVIFYLSVKGKDIKYFAGETTIISSPHKPTRPSFGSGEKDYEIDFSNTNLWKVYLTEEIKSRLKFILKEKNVGLAFKNKSIISIDKEDYNIIKSYVIDDRKLKAEPSGVWIFQVNPKLFRFFDLIRNGEFNKEWWHIDERKKKIQNEIKVGDIVLFWLAGSKNAGIYAMGEIAVGPKMITLENCVIDYTTPEFKKKFLDDNFSCPFFQCRLIKELIDKPILKEFLLNNVILKNLSVIKRPFEGANFRVTKEQWDELKEQSLI